jgi:hypothetical protein
MDTMPSSLNLRVIASQACLGCGRVQLTVGK